MLLSYLDNVVQSVSNGAYINLRMLFPCEYVVSKHFPEAFVNMLALLGWNPGTEEEILSMIDLISSFYLHKVHKAGAKFDHEKAKWFNHKYL